MTVNLSEKDNVLTFQLSGEIDHHAARGLMRSIEAGIDGAMPCECVLDMTGVTFMDSSGIAVILKAFRRMSELDGVLWVDGVQPQAMKVLDAAGLDRLVKITACT